MERHSFRTRKLGEITELYAVLISRKLLLGNPVTQQKSLRNFYWELPKFSELLILVLLQTAASRFINKLPWEKKIFQQTMKNGKKSSLIT